MNGQSSTLSAMKVAGSLVIFAVTFLAIMKGVDWIAMRNVDEGRVALARSAEAEYEIATRAGDTGKACLRAGMAADAYLSAKQEANYLRWKAVFDRCRP